MGEKLSIEDFKKIANGTYGKPEESKKPKSNEKPKENNKRSEKSKKKTDSQQNQPITDQQKENS